jgi:hypothetical protein
LFKYDIEAFVDDELTADQQKNTYIDILSSESSRIYCEMIVYQNSLLKEWWDKKNTQ